MSIYSSLGLRAPPKLILLDLDGTLIDSAPDLSVALDKTLIHFGLSPVGLEKTRQWVGNGAEVLVKRALAGCLSGALYDFIDDGLLKRALSYFMLSYSECCAQQTTLYSGVVESLDYWKKHGVSLACVTNKPIDFAVKLLEVLSIDDFFDLVVGGDSVVEKKPSPAPLLHCIDVIGRPLASALMIGDSKTDILAARAAHIPVVCVSYGYNHGRDITLEKPDLVVDSLLEIR